MVSGETGFTVFRVLGAFVADLGVSLEEKVEDAQAALSFETHVARTDVLVEDGGVEATRDGRGGRGRGGRGSGRGIRRRRGRMGGRGGSVGGHSVSTGTLRLMLRTVYVVMAGRSAVAGFGSTSAPDFGGGGLGEWIFALKNRASFLPLP